MVKSRNKQALVKTDAVFYAQVRDILEWSIPEEVLAVLLKDRSAGRNLIWATDDYAERGKGFCAGDEIRIGEFRMIANNGGAYGK